MGQQIKNIRSWSIALLFSFLYGCAPMHISTDHPPLPYSVTRIPNGEIYGKCAKAWSTWEHILMFPILPLGCAERFPQHNICIVWVGVDSPDWVVEHEIMHCNGYIHN